MSEENAQVMTVKDWMITILVAALPLIGFIMLFVWAFGSGTNPNKSNWAKAALIWTVIFVVLYFLVFASLIGGMMASM